jgi:hypothetical protein
MNPLLFLCALGIAWYGFLCAKTPGAWRILDGANFLFHEAGHLIFRPFGEFLHFLGGTLGQLFFPVVCTGYFWWKGQRFSAAATMCWLAQSLFNISVYAGDAVVTNLPIIEGTIHDWNWMLSRLGWLRHTAKIAWTIYLTGILCYLAGVAGMFYYSFQPMPDLVDD